jgi:hypothetical protein
MIGRENPSGGASASRAGEREAMAAKSAKSGDGGEPKRLNRVVGAGEALAKALDPVFKKRGFASRDIITHWGAMAPTPYDKVAAPDRLAWPRGERGAGGATLYLRCAPGHALALSHEGAKIAAAINRYFGYVLVGAVRLSAEPFTPGSAEVPQIPAKSTPLADGRVERAVAEVGDDGLRDALRRLGRGIMGKAGR